MRAIFLRSLAVLALLAAGQLTPAAAQSTATLQGRVTDTAGAPLAGASVILRGPGSYTATTDSNGSFSIDSVTPGIYAVTITRPGYQPATSDLSLVAGQTQSITVAMTQISFSNLLTIAHVTVAGHATFNASPASINVVPAQAFQNQAATQVRDVLNEIPGIQISLPGGSTNGASPGSITVPTIRDAASYETASLIDGHPLAVEDYGDFVTTFLSSYMFGSVEVIKGPGATAPEVNGAINGTVDFHTKDPTLALTPDFEVGVTNIGGTIADFGVSDTLGKLGFVVAISNVNNPSVLNGKKVLIDPSGLYLTNNAFGPSITDACGNTSFSPPCYTNVAHSESNIQTGFSTLACCYTEQGYLNDTSELVKLRYNLSPATHVMAAYLGVQAFSDQTGNVGNQTVNSVFVPFVPGNTPAYTGPLTPGPQPVVFLYPANYETDNEPMFEGEIGTTVGNDSIIARYYHTDIYRLVTAGQQESGGLGIANPTALTPYTFNLYGEDAFSGASYNGALTRVYAENFFQQVEQDQLTGWSAEWDHPFGVGDDASLAINQTNTKAVDYQLDPGFTSIGLPQGSNQIYTTGQLRGEFFITPKVELTIADYANIYRSQYPVSCPFAFGFSNCFINGGNVLFKTQTTSHNDPRVALEFRPSPNLAVRLSAGSAIAPPYLDLLSQVSPGVASYSASTGYATITQNNPNLKAETAFGYDAGADYRLPDQQTVISADVYLNNLFNHYFGQTVYSGTTCGNPIPCSGSPPPGTKVYYATNTNISNFRFEGVEVSVNRHPVEGLGYTVNAGLQRGYVYDLPAGFYCSRPTPTCISNPALWNQNLNIIAGQNLNGEGIGSVSFPPFYGFGSTVGSLNTREPYSQAYAALSWAWDQGAGYAEFGDTYYGNNNSFNQRPFAIAHAGIRVPIAPFLSVQISGNNIFNTLSGVFPIYGGGIPIPLANASACPNAAIGYGCGSAATLGNVFGPSVYTLMLTKRFNTP
jgi:outer membrane receptor protein involved in Fe transport